MHLDAPGQARCWPCPPNTAGEGCAVCGDFSEAPEEGSAACRCVAGAAPDYSNERCVPCRAGQYQPLPGQPRCLACDGYGTSIAAGATACDGKCVAGSTPTQDGCAPCDAGTAWDGGQGASVEPRCTVLTQADPRCNQAARSAPPAATARRLGRQRA